MTAERKGNGRPPVPLPRYRRTAPGVEGGGSFSATDAQGVLHSGQREARAEFEPLWLQLAAPITYLCLAVSMFGLWLTVRHEHPFVGFAGSTDRYLWVVAAPFAVLLLLVVPLSLFRLRSLRGLRGRTRAEQITTVIMAFTIFVSGQLLLRSAHSDQATVWRLLWIATALLAFVGVVVRYLVFDRRPTHTDLLLLLVLLLAAAVEPRTMFLVISLGFVLAAVSVGIDIVAKSDRERD